MLTTFTQSNVAEAYVLSISDVFDAIWREESKMGKLIRIGAPVTQMKHTWLRDDIFPNTFNSFDDATGKLDTGQQELKVSTAVAKYIRVGTLIKDTAVGLGEVYIVTSKPDGANPTLVVKTWPADATASYDHAQAAKYRIISRPIKEGADPSKDEVTERETEWNAVQLFERGIELSDEAKNIEMRGVSDEEQYQIKKKTREVKDELSYAVMYGPRSAAASTDEYSTMGGFLPYLVDANLKLDADGAELTIDMINNQAQKIKDAGAKVSDCKLLLSTDQSRRLSTIGGNSIQLQRTDNTRGNFVSSVLTDTGDTVEAIVEGDLDSEYAGLVNFNMMEVRPLSGLAWALYTWPRAKYAQQTTLKGDYTFEIRNANKAHAMIYGLKKY